MWSQLFVTSLVLGVLMNPINANTHSCDNVILRERSGNITSPGYPSEYESGLDCRWIIYTPANITLHIKFHDLDVELDSDCITHSHSHCCKLNYVALPAPGGMGIHNYCGKGKNIVDYGWYSVASQQGETIIQFKTTSRGGRGFRLEYKSVDSSTCLPGQFQCKNGACLNTRWRCDNRPECADQSDEHNCYEWCKAHNKTMCGLFPDVQCYNNKTEVCDGHPHCDNRKDEMHCPSAKHNLYPHECPFMCGSGECFRKEQKCNGIRDCRDSSDERHCPIICTSKSGEYIGWSKRCDGKIDCANGMDEYGCHHDCQDGILCNNERKCFPLSQRCDGKNDCEQGIDEWRCPDDEVLSIFQPCPRAADRRCNNEQCIPGDLWCNGKQECEDGSDERHCHVTSSRFDCPNEEDRPCRNNACVPRDYWCNGIDECGDASDEDDCLRNSIIAAAIMAALLCALLVVIAVGCTCRLYNLRMIYTQGFVPPPQLNLRHRLAQNSLTLPNILDDEFYHPDPPPAYSVAVGECPPPPPPISTIPSHNVYSNNQPPRRQRRLGSSRRVRSAHCSSLTPLVESSPTSSDRVLISPASPEHPIPSTSGDKSDAEESSITQLVYSDDSDLLSL